MIKNILLIIIFSFITTNSVLSQLFFEADSIQDAELKVYYVEDESQCDLKVCFVYNEEESETDAHWCEIDDREKADVIIIFVDDKELADINLCVAMECADAGWLNETKKRKLHR